MRSDVLEAHADDLGNVVGVFFGTPIREWDEETSRDRDDDRMMLRIFQSQNNPPAPTPPEIEAMLATGRFVVDSDHCVRTIAAQARNRNPLGIRNWDERMYDYINQTQEETINDAA